MQDGRIRITPKNVKSINKILSEIRKSKNIKQADVARKMKKPQSFISSIENSSLQDRSLKTIVSYLDKCGIAVEFVDKHYNPNSEPEEQVSSRRRVRYTDGTSINP